MGLHDEDVGTGSAGSGYDVPVDDAWAEQFEGQEQAGEGEASILGETLPAFPYYVVRFDRGKGGFTRGEKHTPVARVSCKVVEGPSDSVGARVFDDIFLRVSKTTTENGLVVPKSAKQYQEDVQASHERLNRIARVGKFAVAKPQAPNEDAIDAYAQQFGNPGFDAVLQLLESTDTYNNVTRTKNRIWWKNLRALDDPAIGRKAKPGQSALDQAREKIEEANKAAAARNPNAGRTASSVSRKPGSLAD